MIEYPRGSIICEENSAGEEMYILQTGAIDVEIGGNKVATIDKKGTVIGEMALLLNEKDGNIEAKNITSNNSNQKIKRDMRETGWSAEGYERIYLAQKHYYNIIKINTVE